MDARTCSSVTCRSKSRAITRSPNRLKQPILVSTRLRRWDDDYKNRLRNLTLLEKPINIVAGNYFYTAKQIEYSKSGNYLTRSLVVLTDVGKHVYLADQRKAGGLPRVEWGKYRKAARDSDRLGADRLEDLHHRCLIKVRNQCRRTNNLPERGLPPSFASRSP